MGELKLGELVLRTFKGRLKRLESNQVFVFGANTEGRHGAGSALWAAVNAGAKRGVSEGLQGRSWAILTKNLKSINHPSVPKDKIIEGISKLYIYAATKPDIEFIVPYANMKNLNGYTPEQMVWMFFKAGPIPGNMVFREDFAELMERYYHGKTESV